jgi:septal ring factor EnvC (AmiA/AmiB activator)
VLARLDRTVAEKTGLGEYEAELKAREALQIPAGPGEPPAPPAPSTKSGTDVALLPAPKAVEIAPRSDAAALNPGRLKPTIAFASAKGRLPLPAIGRRVLSFGEKTQYGGQSKGMVVETRHSAQVISPADGWVVYAGPFRSFGQLLIINPGSGYHILLAGMHQIDVQLGQFVLASEPVGTMAPAPKRASQDSAPVLYVEFRKDQKSIDPDPWWADSAQKVQG